jgi:hypothetical protein
MSAGNVLPEALREQVLAMPEYSMGVTRIRVTLDDGTRFSDVFVAWGTEIVKVGVSTEVPFDAAKIVAVERQ